MTKTSGGSAIDQNGASEPTREEHGKAGKPSVPGRDRDEASADGPEAIDLDTARDRAS